MNREKPATGEVYHVFNRGVEKRDVFMKSGDYLRFIHDLYEFNDANPTIDGGYRFSKTQRDDATAQQPNQKIQEV